MSDLVIGRCSAPAAHLLFRVYGTPRGYEIEVVTDFLPRTRAALREYDDEVRSDRGEPASERPISRHRREVHPLVDALAVESWSGVLRCKCQAPAEMSSGEVVAEIKEAVRTGRTRTVRVPFA